MPPSRSPELCRSTPLLNLRRPNPFTATELRLSDIFLILIESTMNLGEILKIWSKNWQSESQWSLIIYVLKIFFSFSLLSRDTHFLFL